MSHTNRVAAGGLLLVLAGMHPLLLPAPGATVALDIESGAVFAGGNDVRVPGDTGTEFSLTSDLETEARAFWRLRGTYRRNERHEWLALWAPLSLASCGQRAAPLIFAGQEYPSGTPLAATYRFDSYRLTYRYHFAIGTGIDGALGLTAKIRDAEIRVRGAGRDARTKNTGFVPLIAFALDWAAAGDLHVRIEGDALAGPQGRAEDVFLGFTLPLTRAALLRGGYRVLEGGADVEQVYNFALLHYAVLGISILL